jgi:hypothetical protein
VLQGQDLPVDRVERIEGFLDAEQPLGALGRLGGRRNSSASAWRSPTRSRLIRCATSLGVWSMRVPIFLICEPRPKRDRKPGEMESVPARDPISDN